MLNSVDDLLSFFQKSDEFIAAVQYTAGRFNFTSALIEKDYLCSLILMYLYNNKNIPLLFKGGTLLTKVHTDFNRLSEDLDFAIPTLPNITRNQRSQQIRPIKKLFNNIHEHLPIFTIKQPLIGYDDSRQYAMILAYQSNVTRSNNKILIDIGMRDELLLPPDENKAGTLLMDPFLYKNKVPPFMVIGLNRQEAYAEKIRAALCRKELAIRDFYDLDCALIKKLIELNDNAFITLVKKKVKHEKHFHDFNNPDIIKFLQAKIKSELEPTLKRFNGADFNLERIIEKLLNLSNSIK